MTVEVITSSRIWSRPNGLTKASVSIYGGGGSGADGETFHGARSGYGGNAGKAATPETFDIDLTQDSYTLVVGGPNAASSGFGHVGYPGVSGSGYMVGTGAGGAGGSGYGSSVSATNGANGGGGGGSGGAGGSGYGAGGGGGGGSGAVSGEGGAGGSGAQGVIVITYTLPTASITPSPASGNAPLAVTLMGSVTGSPTAYDWNFGDGSSHGSTQNASHTYSLTGTYTVTYTVYNDYGYVVVTSTVTVYWKPGARVTIISAEPWRR